MQVKKSSAVCWEYVVIEGMNIVCKSVLRSTSHLDLGVWPVILKTLSEDSVTQASGHSEPQQEYLSNLEG